MTGLGMTFRPNWHWYSYFTSKDFQFNAIMGDNVELAATSRAGPDTTHVYAGKESESIP